MNGKGMGKPLGQRSQASRTSSALSPTLAQPPEGNPVTCSRPWARVMMILVALHALAVLAEPLRFFSQSDVQAAPEFLALRRITAPYSEWLYLDHGYFFFAPNPGPSHLVGARIVSPPPIAVPSLSVGVDPTRVDMKSIAPDVMNPDAMNLDAVNLDDFADVFPDRRRQWPRLLYHRYFMLSEFYYNRFAPPELPEELRDDAPLMARWRKDRRFYESLRDSIASSLAHRHGVEKIELARIERELFSPEQVIFDGWGIDDPRGLLVLPENRPAAAAVEIPSNTEVVVP